MNADKEYISRRFDEIMDRIDDFEEHLRIIEMNRRLSSCERLLDTKDVCFILGVNKKTLERKCKDGELKSYKIHRRIKYKIEDVKEYVQNNLVERKTEEIK